VYREVVSFFIRYNDNIHTNFCKIWIYDTAIVSVITFSLFTHIKVKSRPNSGYKFVSTIRLITYIVSISDIFCMFRSSDNFWINSSSHEPCIYFIKIIVSISRGTSMVIESASRGKYSIPIICRLIKACIVDIS